MYQRPSPRGREVLGWRKPQPSSFWTTVLYLVNYKSTECRPTDSNKEPQRTTTAAAINQVESFQKDFGWKMRAMTLFQ